MNGTGRQRAMDALRMHVPELAGVAVIELGHGLDNTAFIAEDLVLRVAAGRGSCLEIRRTSVAVVVGGVMGCPPAHRRADPTRWAARWWPWSR